MIPTKTLNLDFWRYPTEVLHLVQGESAGRTLRFNLVEGTEPLSLTAATGVMFAVKKSDDTVTVDAATIVDAANGIVDVTFSSQSVAAAGDAIGELHVITENSLTKSFNIPISIQPSVDIDGIAPSVSEFNALQTLIGQAETVISIADTDLWPEVVANAQYFSDLAGTGRTVETVKANADEIAALEEEIETARDGAATLGARLDADKLVSLEELNDPGWYPESTDTTDNVSCALFNEIDNGAEVSISNGTEGAGVVAAGRNLFDVSQVTASRFINSGGNVGVGSNHTLSAKMRVPPSGQKITLKRCKSYIWYGADGTTVISYEYKSTTILRVLTVPANAAYIQFDCLTETQDMSDIVVVFGEYTAETLPALTAYVTPVIATINASGEATITWETGLITLFVSVGTVSVSYVEPWYEPLKNVVTQNDLSPYAPDIVTRILLPNEIVAVTGEKMQVFLRGILESQSPYGEIIKATCDIGRLCHRYMEFEPTAPNVGDHTLTVQILDKNCAVKRTASTVIKVVAAIGQPASNKNVLLIGDSLTSDGERAIEMHRRLCLTGGSPAGKGYSNITFIGNKSDSGGAKWVGTGGWIWQNYTELVAANPFYNSGNNTIDFVNFCNNVGASGIDIVYVLLGWNQVGNPNRPNASDHSATITAAKVLIDKLKLDYPGVQVRIMGLQMPSPHGGLGANYGMNSTLSDYYPLIRSVHGLNTAYQALANEVAYSSWVRFLTVAPCFDSDYNMPYNNADVNSRNSTVTEQKGSNGVHPALAGYQQIADVQFRDFIRTYCSS